MKNCKQCGKPFTLRSHYNDQTFCSQRCRKQYWQVINRTRPKHDKLLTSLNNKYTNFNLSSLKHVDLSLSSNASLVQLLEDKAGVYGFIAKEGYIYVGSSSKLKTRVNSYISNHISRDSIFFNLWRLKYNNIRFFYLYYEEYKELESYLILKYKPIFDSSKQKKLLTIKGIMEEIRSIDEETFSVKKKFINTDIEGDVIWIRKQLKRKYTRELKIKNKNNRILFEL